jgi:hypothetical protein
MAMQTLPCEETGRRYNLAAAPTERPGFMTLAISGPDGGSIVRAELESGELSRARFTGRVMKFAENASVSYRVISNGIAARIGFLFGFIEGEESHSILVERDSLDWLLTATD